MIPAFGWLPVSDGAGNGLILDVRDLEMQFAQRAGIRARGRGVVRAVDGVNLTVRAGEALGLVGETGCGKTTLGRCIARAYQPTGGQILYHDRNDGIVDLATIRGRALRPYRRDVRVVFQDPFSSLNPRMNLLQIVGEPIKLQEDPPRRELEERVAVLLEKVGLSREHLRRYPHAFSGGQRQRVGIARALATNPRLVIADEAVSALDVSVRAQVLNLLEDLQADANLTYLMITHDLRVVDYLCQRVAVMYLGKVVELADTTAVYETPQHPYTETLLAAILDPDPRVKGRRRRIPASDLPDAANPPSGCAFHPRCKYAEDICRTQVPSLRESARNHIAACHFAGQLPLVGAEA